MALITPDLTDVGAIKPGTYRGRVVAVQQGVSKAGNAKEIVTFELSVGDKKRNKDAHMVTSGAGARNFMQFLKCAGFGEYVRALKDENIQPKPDFDDDELIDCEVLCVIDNQEYNGDITDNIVSYLPV